VSEGLLLTGWGAYGAKSDLARGWTTGVGDFSDVGGDVVGFSDVGGGVVGDATVGAAVVGACVVGASVVGEG